MSEHVPEPFNPRAVECARAALDATTRGDIETASMLVAIVMDKYGMPGIHDTIFTWCAAIHARLGIPPGTPVAVAHINHKGQVIPPPHDDPTYVWATSVVQAYIAHDKGTLTRLIEEMGDNPERMSEHLAALIEHAAQTIRTAVRQMRAVWS